MVYEYTIHGLALRTGDLICTTDGGGELLAGQFWRLIGKLIPGDVDHIVIYIGPQGRCVEAGATGRAIEFEVPGDTWDPDAMFSTRNLIDTFYGVAYPLVGQDLSETRENEIREEAAAFCLKQAAAGKPYNINFLNSDTEDAFYCSQLAYRAYRNCGIDLNTNRGVPDIPGTDTVIFPQEIWEGCVNRRASS
jgi:Permuted papain-like amidase enzyme, YaeF/YiiX, C92 family